MQWAFDCYLDQMHYASESMLSSPRKSGFRFVFVIPNIIVGYRRPKTIGFYLFQVTVSDSNSSAGIMGHSQHMLVVTWFWQLPLQPSVLTLLLQQPDLAYQRSKPTLTVLMLILCWLHVPYL